MRSPSILRDRLRVHGDQVALLIATAAIVVAVTIEAVRVTGSSAPAGPLVAVGLVVAGAVITVRLPYIGVVIASAATLVAALSGWEPIVEWSCAVFVLFTVTLRTGRPVLAALLCAPFVVTGTVLSPSLGQPVSTSVGVLISIAAASAVAFGLRVQRQYRTALEQRAADAIATREVEAERRVAEERLRIARDLHDVVGHEVAVVSMNIGVAEVALPPDAGQAHAALQNARAGVRNVLDETQRILSLLRASDETSPSAPTPGFGSVAGLIESYRQIGLAVDTGFDVADERQIDATTGLTVYRVLQETLTNAHRYGRGSATVRCWTTPDRVWLEVRNPPGTALEQVGGGLGLIGMRERVAHAGGSVTVDGNSVVFVVTVDIPLQRKVS